MVWALEYLRTRIAALLFQKCPCQTFFNVFVHLGFVFTAKHNKPVANAKEAAIPAPVRKEVDVTKLDSILKPQEKAVGVDAIESKAAPAEVAAGIQEPVYEEEPEMDFPARVINIKIENDQLRARLDALE